MGREFAPSGTEVFRNHRKFPANSHSPWRVFPVKLVSLALITFSVPVFCLSAIRNFPAITAFRLCLTLGFPEFSGITVGFFPYRNLEISGNYHLLIYLSPEFSGFTARILSFLIPQFSGFLAGILLPKAIILMLKFNSSFLNFNFGFNKFGAAHNAGHY